MRLNIHDRVEEAVTKPLFNASSVRFMSLDQSTAETFQFSTFCLLGNKKEILEFTGGMYVVTLLMKFN